MKIGHIALWVHDLEVIKEFYLRNFNCTSNEKYVNKSKGFSSYFICFSEGAAIEIMKREDIDKKRLAEATGYTHIAITLENRASVDELTEELKKRGVNIESDPRLTGDGYYESVISDPEGNLIELVSKS